MSTNPRVVIADDAVLLREGIRQLLTAGGCDVVGMAGDAEELHAFVHTHVEEIDAIVLDIRMPPTNTDEGVRELERLRQEGSTLGVLLLSMYASPTLALRALSAGGPTGYLLKDRVKDGATLVDAVRTVSRGGVIVDPEVVALMVSATSRTRLTDTLTPRELEVLKLMAQGRSNNGIGQALHLSVKTVETHVEHILDKLDIEPSPQDHRRVSAVLRMLRSRE